MECAIGGQPLGLSYLEESARVIRAKFFLHAPMKNGDVRPVFLDAYGYTSSECAQYTVHEEWRRRLMRKLALAICHA